MHFYLEHNYGHHLNVATKDDAVTAKYNQPIVFFLDKCNEEESLSQGQLKIQKIRLNRTIIFLFFQFIQ